MSDEMFSFLMGMLIGLLMGGVIGGGIGFYNGYREGQCVELSPNPVVEAKVLCQDNDYRDEIIEEEE